MKYKIMAGALAFSVCSFISHAGESKKEFNTGGETYGISFNEGSSTYVQDQTLAPSRGLFKKTRVWTMPKQEGQARDIGIREVKYATYLTKLIRDEGGRSRWCPIPIAPREDVARKELFKAVRGLDGKFKAQRRDGESMDEYFKTMILTTDKTWAEQKRPGVRPKEGELLMQSIVDKMNKQKIDPMAGKINLKKIPQYVNLELKEGTLEQVLNVNNEEQHNNGTVVWVNNTDGKVVRIRAKYYDISGERMSIERPSKTIKVNERFLLKVRRSGVDGEVQEKAVAIIDRGLLKRYWRHNFGILDVK